MKKIDYIFLLISFIIFAAAAITIRKAYNGSKAKFVYVIISLVFATQSTTLPSFYKNVMLLQIMAIERFQSMCFGAYHFKYGFLE